jgi:simple sugar transport system permease protein
MIISALLSFMFALLVGAIIIQATGSDALDTYGVLLKGALGSKNAISESLIKTSILLLTGLSFTFASKCGLINIGAEGQLYMGAACSTAIGIYGGAVLPDSLLLPCALLGGFIAGAFWGGVVGILKSRFNSNEIITSIMLNYVAVQFISYLVSGPMKDTTQTFPYSPLVSESAKLPVILEGTRLHSGVFIALACLLFYWFFYRYTVKGYRMRVIGQNRRCAEYAGFNVPRNTLFVLLVGGGFAGLGGAMEVLGIQHRLFENFSVGYGFDGIASALLAGGNPAGMLLTAFLFGSLKNGANAIQMFTKVPSSLTEIVQAVVIITVLMKVFSQIPSRRPHGKKELQPHEKDKPVSVVKAEED